MRAQVFVDDDGGFGNGVQVIVGEPVPPPSEREEIARAAPDPATVFVGADRRGVRIHNRMLERPFAGHPLLGTAAVLAALGAAPDELVTPAGPVRMWCEAGVWWLSAPAAWSPNARHRQVSTPAEVVALPGAPPDEPVQVWAWVDEAAGVVRARQFAPSEGKPEDEACGSASMVLAADLGRPLTVLHGKGSVIRVRPVESGVDLGGRCTVG